MNCNSVLRNLRFSILILVGSLIIQSCWNKSKTYIIKDPSPYFTDFYALKDNSILRGIQFNSKADEIIKTEKAKLYDKTNDHLFYEYTFPKDSTSFSEYANVQYFFDENKLLDIITVDIYLNDSLQEKSLNASIIQYFNQRYGNSESDEKKYLVWKDKFQNKITKKEQEYSVAMKKLDNDYGLKIEYLRE